VLVPLLLGGSVALPAPQQSDGLAEWVLDLNPTWFSASPSYLQAAVDRIRSRGGGKLEHSLRFISLARPTFPSL
jgi:hypothetical protein